MTIIAVLLLLSISGFSQYLQVSKNGHYFVKDNGEPFFWLGDTAWELLHRLHRGDAEMYLRNRAGKGFTVIQTVILAECNGLTEPTPDGLLPLNNLNPDQPNEAFFKLVDDVVQKAAEFGLYMALLPTWGSWTEDRNHPLFENHPVFTPDNAYSYGKFLGNRYKNNWNVVWILGGDREGAGRELLIESMARGLKEGCENRQLISYHPQSNSANWFHQSSWLNFNMIQSGHAVHSDKRYRVIEQNVALQPAKPTLDGEICYENHPIGFNKINGLFTAYDVRKAAYWSVFAGGAGVTYGHASIWHMDIPERKSPLSTGISWQIAMDAPAAYQMRFVKQLIQSRPQLSRISDPTILVSPSIGVDDHLQATRDGDLGKKNATYIMVYSPIVRSIKVDTHCLSANKIKTWWYDPRTGAAYPIGTFENSGSYEPGWNGRISDSMGGPDWVLVIDDASKGYPAPGTRL